MGAPRGAPEALSLAAVMHRPEIEPGEVLGEMASVFGRVTDRSPTFSFEESDYYRGEMGDGLRKFIVAFERPVAQESLADIKLATNGIEQRAASDGRRCFNLDPGIMTLSTFVLATTKGHAHRIYLGRGIYAEATLLFENGAWRAQPWTYPDYRRPDVLEFLGRVRRAWRQGSCQPEAGR